VIARTPARGLLARQPRRLSRSQLGVVAWTAVASFALGALIIVIGALLIADGTFALPQLAVVVIGFILVFTGLVIDFRVSHARR
jgi:membrane-bound ClpP family serine protease